MVYARFRLWKKLEIFEAIFAILSADADKENLSIDSTACKVHVILYNRDAQQFIMDNLPELLEKRE